MIESRLSVEHLSLGYGPKTVVKDVSFTMKKGEILTLLGANGEGKTTLIKAVCAIKKIRKGQVLVNGENIRDMDHGRRAALISYVPQVHRPGLPMTVRDMVVLGRQYCRGLFSEPAREDYGRADEILAKLSLSDRGDDLFTALSGGEQRLVLIARALIQSADYMVLDEPVSNLDLGNQIRVLKVLEELALGGTGILMSSHFPQHSLWMEAKTIILNWGSVLACGSAEDVITGGNLTRIYGTPISVFKDGEGTAWCGPDYNKPDLARSSTGPDSWINETLEMIL